MVRRSWRVHGLCLICAFGCGARSDLTPSGVYGVSVVPSLTLIQGGPRVSISVNVAREGDLADPIYITVSPLPEGIEATSATIPPNASNATIELNATSVASQGDQGKVTVRTRSLLAEEDAAIDVYVRGCPGCLDTTFGAHGAVQMLESGLPTSLGVDAMDDLFLGTELNSQHSFYQLTPEGATTTGYGQGGVATLPFPFSSVSLHASVVESDGSVVVGGMGNFGGNDEPALIRLTSTGAIDPTFGEGGVAIVPYSETAPTGIIALQQLPSFILTIGTTGGSTPGAWSTRLRSDGTVDTTFGNQGQVVFDVVGAWYATVVGGVSVNEQFVLAGSSTGQPPTFALIRYDADGSRDPTFDSAAVPGQVQEMLQIPNGEFVLGGQDGSQSTLARYMTDGSLDETFGSGGVVMPTPSLGTSTVASVVAQPDGKLIAIGATPALSTDPVATSYIARLLPDGSLDASFGIGGTTSIELDVSPTTATCGTLQSDGRIIVGGYLWRNLDAYTFLVRYWP